MFSAITGSRDWPLVRLVLFFFVGAVIAFVLSLLVFPLFSELLVAIGLVFFGVFSIASLFFFRVHQAASSARQTAVLTACPKQIYAALEFFGLAKKEVRLAFESGIGELLVFLDDGVVANACIDEYFLFIPYRNLRSVALKKRAGTLKAVLETSLQKKGTIVYSAHSGGAASREEVSGIRQAAESQGGLMVFGDFDPQQVGRLQAALKEFGVRVKSA